MKTQSTVTAIVFSLLSLSVIGQETKDLEKQKTIEENPLLYKSQGGVLTENREPKDPQEKKPDFVIHKSTSETEGERELQYQTLEVLNMYVDQTSIEYQLLKEQWIKENKFQYEMDNPAVPTEQEMSAEDRRKKFYPTH